MLAAEEEEVDLLLLVVLELVALVVALLDHKELMLVSLEPRVLVEAAVATVLHQVEIVLVDVVMVDLVLLLYVT